MKLRINLLLLAFITIFVSCSSDDDQPQGAEDTPIAEQKVLDNIIVEGGTKEPGAPDTPNEAVSFTLKTDNTNAVLIDGFNIELSSDDNITGAYLQIKGTDGSVADGYYDIDLSEVGNKKELVKSRKIKKSAFPKLKAKTAQKSSAENEATVDVDFTPIIEPGTFCYVVCVYDANGNISAPQEVCVTVQSWGGNDALAGVWNYTKEVEYYNGETNTTNVGEEDCYDGTVSCTNGSTVNYSECYVTNALTFTINANGTYQVESQDSDNYIDYSASSNACQAIYNEEEGNYISKGNWAYDQQKGEMVLVELESIETYNGETDTETNDPGDGYVFELKAEVNGNSLILTEEFTNTNGTVEEYYKVYFDKQ